MSSKGAEDKGALALPAQGTRKIMKLNDEVHYISEEAVLIMSKATEQFATLLAEEARDVVIMNNKKIIKIEDIIEAIRRKQDQFAFLNTAFTGPKKKPPGKPPGDHPR